MAISNHRLTPEEYQQNFSDIHPPFGTKDAALVEANRCLFCYDAPCTKSCPTGINVPKFIKQITTDNVKGSAYTIFSANIMGGGCSKVCPVEKLCEGACVYNLMDEEAIPIAKLQRYATEKAIREKWPLFQRKAPSGQKVAIVGAGPAGLSCAHTLSREGIDVTIYEKEHQGGGLMTYGIAAYKVTPEFCAEELDYILGLGGIDIKYEQNLGTNLFLKDLQQNYDAVFLAFGVGLTRQLAIPGEELQGVTDALHFIYAIRTRDYPTVSVGDKVVVIGMGMTAIDAATQAKRLGAAEVTLVYRRTEAEMPCTQTELDLAKLDGCRIHWLAAPKEIIGADGRVTQLVCSVMQLGEPDASGRRSPIDTGQTFTLDTDMVIKATGQMPFQALIASNGLPNQSGKIVTDGQGAIQSGGIHSDTHGLAPQAANGREAMNWQGVFAGGDCVNGGKEVVDAVQAGKDSATAILHYLNNRS